MIINKQHWDTVAQVKPTGDTEPSWGGGETTEDPVNQVLLVRGSAATKVICGRLEDKPQ